MPFLESIISYFLNLLRNILHNLLNNFISHINEIQSYTIFDKINLFVNTYIYYILIEPPGDWDNISWYNFDFVFYENYKYKDLKMQYSDNAIIVLKIQTSYIVRVVKSHYYFQDIMDELRNNIRTISHVRFINIEYTYPGLKKIIQIILPIHYFVVDNEILSSTFILRYIKYNYGNTCEFNDNYTLLIIDNNVKSFTINKNQYISLTNENYTIKQIK